MKPFVLVVDDDETVRTVMAEVLRQDGHYVLCAANGADALDVMRVGPVPELVLLDLMMPEVTGWQVLAAMSESPRLASVPVVVLTAFDSLDDIPAGRPVLHKPMESTFLLELVRALLDQGRNLASALEDPPSDLMPPPSALHAGGR